MKTPTAPASDPLEDCDAILSAINTLHSNMEDVLTHTREKLAEVDRLWDVSCPVPNDPNGPNPCAYNAHSEELQQKIETLEFVLSRLNRAYVSVQVAGLDMVAEEIL